MEVFTIKKDLDFDLKVWIEKLSVQSGDILLMKTNKDIPEEVINEAKEQFIELVHKDEKFRNVRFFILSDSEIDLFLLTDEQLEKMGLMRIPEISKK
jgi:hypothetical protein